MINPADIYEKIIVWSEEDRGFIGTCPDLFNGGVHGKNQLEVFKEMCEVVDEWVKIFKEDGKPLAEPKRVLETV